MDKNITSTERSVCGIDNDLRPALLADYIGQPLAKQQLEVFMAAAKKRGGVLDHTLLFGSPGLGKTTLAIIIATEMGAKLHMTTGPALERAGDIAALMAALEPGDVLFIDEIHRLHPAIEETMYSALEDFRLDIVVGEGTGSRTVKLDLPPFTLVGATTKAGRLTSPLYDRFGIVCNLDFYNDQDMQAIVRRSSALLDLSIDEAGVQAIATRARRTPRIANRLLRRTRDYAEVKADGKINSIVAEAALAMLGVDHAGLDIVDKRYLSVLLTKFGGGPVGVETLSVALGEEVETLEAFVEPYLIKEGFIARSPRGRIATAHAYQHTNLEPPLRSQSSATPLI